MGSRAPGRRSSSRIRACARSASQACISLMLSNLPVLSTHVLRLNFITMADAPMRSLGVRGKRRKSAREKGCASGDEGEHSAVADVRFRGQPRHLFPKSGGGPFVLGIVQAEAHPVYEDFHFAGGHRLVKGVPLVEASTGFVSFIRQSM